MFYVQYYHAMWLYVHCLFYNYSSLQYAAKCYAMIATTICRQIKVPIDYTVQKTQTIIYHYLTVTFLQKWARAMISSLYFRAQIFCDENKGLIVMGTFSFKGALI
jgi:hypothetical protein